MAPAGRRCGTGTPRLCAALTFAFLPAGGLYQAPVDDRLVHEGTVSETVRLGVRPWKSRVLRGGCWNNDGRKCRSGNRNANDPANRNRNVGFRVVRLRSSVQESDDQGTDPGAFLTVGMRCRPAAKSTDESPVLVAEVDASKPNALGFPFPARNSSVRHQLARRRPSRQEPSRPTETASRRPIRWRR